MASVTIEHIVGVGIFISGIASAVFGFIHSRRQRLYEDEEIERRFEHSVRRARSGLPVIPIKEIYGKE